VARHLKGLMLTSSFLMMAVVVILTGCSTKSPVTPQYDQPNSLQSLTAVASENLSVEEIGQVEVAKTILPTKADTIQIAKDASLHKFALAKGAVTAATVIDVKSFNKEINGKSSLVFEFGPEGLVFAKAANLDIDVKDLGDIPKSANLYYFDPNVNDWVYQGTVLVKNGRVTFKIYHFSKYAISG
jgi:hypothetical protein